MRGLIPDNGKMENCQPGHNMIRMLRKCTRNIIIKIGLTHSGNPGGPEMITVEMD